MGYQFSNNWPYSYSVFPTMEDHVDPVNEEYFSGLHTEIENIEDELGLNPSGDYDTVKARLDDILNLLPWGIRQVKTFELAADVNTTSASLVDITGVTITLTTGANKLLILATMSGDIYRTSEGAGAVGQVTLNIDTVDEIGSGVGKNDTPQGVNDYWAAAITMLESVSAGEHTIKLRWRQQTGGTLIRCSATTWKDHQHCTLTVIELAEN